MAYVTPTSKTTGDLIAATDWNENTVDNPIALRAGGIAIASQAANDVIYASSSTQLARLPAGTAGQVLATQGAGSAPSWIDQSQGLRQSFRGLTLRTHPDADLAASRVYLDHADEIVLNDGTRVADWDDLTAAITASGAGGLDTGSEGASRWYEIHAIRKSSDGTKGLLLHRAKNYASDQTQTTDNTAQKLRDAASHTRLAQSFVAGLSGPLPFVDTRWNKTGTPTGRVWFTIEADSAGVPSGTPLATSDKLDATLISTSDQWIRSIFRSPTTLVATTTYWLVAYGDFTIDASHYLSWQESSSSSYANGAAYRWDGATWTADAAGHDFCFTTYITQNDTAVTMPSGYDQRAQVGWVYNNSSSDFSAFAAKDRLVRQYGVAVSSGTATVSTLTDTTAGMHPPCPLMMTEALVSGDFNGRDIYISSTISINTQFADYMTGQGAGYWEATALAIPVEFQHFYYRTQGDATFIYPTCYKW